MPYKNAADRKKWLEDNKEKTYGYHRKWVNANREHIKAYLSDWGKVHPENVRANYKRWAATKNVYALRKMANPKAMRAQSIARQNIPLKGRVCARCGTKEKLTRHHPDYDYPLDVVILCRDCHIKETVRLKEAKHGIMHAPGDGR